VVPGVYFLSNMSVLKYRDSTYEVTWSCAFVAVSDRPTGRAVRLNPDVTARAIWQSVRRLG
jgi:hypothetical protein